MCDHPYYSASYPVNHDTGTVASGTTQASVATAFNQAVKAIRRCEQIAGIQGNHEVRYAMERARCILAEFVQ